MELQSALFLLGCFGLLAVGLLVAFFVFRKTIKTTKTLLLVGLLGAGAFVLIMVVAALLAARG
jgi:hypothetical protein